MKGGSQCGVVATQLFLSSATSVLSSAALAKGSVSEYESFVMRLRTDVDLALIRIHSSTYHISMRSCKLKGRLLPSAVIRTWLLVRAGMREYNYISE